MTSLKRLRFLLIWEIKASQWIDKGKQKSRMGELPSAILAGGAAASLLQNSLNPFLISILVRIVMAPIFLTIGYLYRRLGAMAAESEYFNQTNPDLQEIKLMLKELIEWKNKLNSGSAQSVRELSRTSGSATISAAGPKRKPTRKFSSAQ